MVEIAEFVAGLVVTGFVLYDVVASILIPGPNKGRFGVAINLRHVSLPVWRRFAKARAGGRRQRLANIFAPLLFLMAFGTWIILLMLGFGLMFHASGRAFNPPLTAFDQALYVAGSSLVTLGVSEVDATGHARWLMLWAALSGFGVITAAFTYILQVQNSLHQRESGVLTLSGLAGKPPSGVVLLESFAHLRLRSELTTFFRDWRNWSTATLHSHVSFPVLAYFHSVDAESDWLSALGTVLDAASIVMDLTDEESAGAAALMHRAGSRTVAHLCDLFDLEAETAEAPGEAAVSALVGRLEAVGFRMKPSKDLDAARLAKLTADYAGRLAALSTHLGAERPRFLEE